MKILLKMVMVRGQNHVWLNDGLVSNRTVANKAMKEDHYVLLM